MTDPTPSSLPARLWRFLISPKLTVICLSVLMVLTFWGTVYQVDNGLYGAKARYFDSFLCWIGFIPFPGAQLAMAVLVVNLTGYLIQLLLRSQLHLGVVLTHVGLLLLLGGGAVTHYYGDEGHLTLAEGEASNVASAYHSWELALWSTDMGVQDVRARNADHLKAGAVFSFPEPGLTVSVDAYHRNAQAFRDSEGGRAESRRGIGRIEAAPLMKEPERNRPGAVLSLTWAGAETRRVLLFGEDATAPLEIGGKSYTLALRHRRYPLPATIELKDFQREMHPGTSMAKSYASVVKVTTSAGEREVRISMNKPLRERGFTFYQSSFSDDGQGSETSTFAVTRNAGRLLPYVATTVVFIGMAIHFAAMLVRRAKGGSAP